jgi:WD40 repeat protein
MDGFGCPSANQLGRLLSESLASGESDRIAAHVEVCKTCQRRLDAMDAEDNIASLPRIADPSSDPGPDRVFIDSLGRMVVQAVDSTSVSSSGLDDEGGRIRAEASTNCPSAIGDYEIVSEIARGGMAVVYKARQPRLGRIVALKRLKYQDQDSSDIERFRREADAVARLHHPNIVQVFEVGDDDGRPFFALEYVPGPTLADYVKGSPVEPRSAAECLRKVALAVHHAHEQGVIHRDLKPANVLLEPVAETTRSPASVDANGGRLLPLSSFEPKVADFGLARRIGDDKNLTLPDMLAGTPAYLSPEQVGRKSDAISPASDVYALGAILYEMLTSRPPLVGPNLFATLRLVETADPVAPRTLQPQLPRDLESVCVKCLAKEPRQRYATAADLAADLERFLTGKPTVARPLSILARTGKLVVRHPIAAAVVVVSLLVTCCGVAAVLWQWSAAVTARQNLEVALTAEAKQRQDAEENLYYGRLAQARELWESGETSQARTLLDASRPTKGRADLRGWEWYYLTRQFRRETNVIQFDHWVNGLAPLPEHTAASAGLAVAVGRPIMNAYDRVRPGDGTAGYVITTTPTSEFQPGPDLPGAARAVAVHPEGRFVAWGTNTGKIVVTRGATRELAYTITLPSPVSRICFTADGAALLVTCEDAHLRAYELAAGHLLHDELARVGRPWAIAVHPGGSLIACGGGVGFVRLYDFHDWKVVAELPGHAEGITSLEFSPTGSSLAAGCRDGSIVLWDVKSRREERRIQSVGGPANAITFRPDGKALAVAGADRTVRTYDPITERLLATYRGHESNIRCLAFADRGQSLASGGQDGAVRVWDATTDGRGRLIPFDQRLNDAAFNFTPDGLLIVAASGNGHVNTWSAVNGRQQNRQEVPMAPVRAYPRRYMAFISGGRRLVGIDRDDANSLVVCDPLDGSRLAKMSSGSGPVQALAVDCSGRLLTWATAAGENAVDIHWRDADANDQPAPFRLEVSSVISLAIVPAGGRIAALTAAHHVTGEQSLWVFDLSGVSPPREIVHDIGMFGGLTFSPDGRLLAVADRTDVQVYRTVTWELASRIPIPPSTTSLAFSPDGRRLAAVGYDGNATLLDAAAGKRVLQLRSLGPHRPDEMASNARIAFSPDGNWLLSTNWDGSINVWDGTPTGE